MMKKKTVVVVFGGVSPEYEVSLMSSYSVIKAINTDKYDVIKLGITKDGQWYRFSGDVEDVLSGKWIDDDRYLTKAFIPPTRCGGIMELIDDKVTILPVDIVFPVFHGKNGEDGTIQGLCELAGLKLVGSGSAASALCMDKYRAQKLVEFEGIKITKAICYEQKPSDERLISEAKALNLPIFVKPVKGGSSIGVTKVDDYSQLPEAVKLAYEYDDVVMIEQGVIGKEVGCSVMGNNELITGRVNEIKVSVGIFDYNEKYTLANSEIIVPARIDEDTEKCIQEVGKKVFKILGCKGYARMDLFLTDEGDIVFNEANTIPGFTTVSQFPGMMKAAGMDYKDVVDKLIELGLE